jgi:transcription elongation GreA/GreB family factor
MEEKYYITPAGYRRFIQKMKAAAAHYDSYLARCESAAEAGDNSVWHDNFAYEQNQRDLHQWAKTYNHFEKIKEKMVLLDIDPTPDEVKIGCEVTVYDLIEGCQKTFSIVGYEDGDPQSKRISYTTPLVQAIMGANTGDICEFRVGKKKSDLEIRAISPLKED